MNMQVAADHPSGLLGQALVQALIDEHVADVVLAPGSRNSALSYALYAAHEQGLLRLHMRLDERSAGYFALGLTGVERDRPVAVVTTSGTAVANLHPSVLEASHAGIPLLLVTADRPSELYDTGANQTVDQQRIFGSSLRYFGQIDAPDVGELASGPDRLQVVRRAVARARGDRSNDPGPVQINVSLRGPMTPLSQYKLRAQSSQPQPTSTEVTVAQRGQQATSMAPAVLTEMDFARTVILAGTGMNPEQRQALAHLAEVRQLPILAEPASGLHAHPNALPAASMLLDRSPATGDVRHAIVGGRLTLARAPQRLLSAAHTYAVLTDGPNWADIAGRGVLVSSAELAAAAGQLVQSAMVSVWLARWQDDSAVLQQQLASVCDGFHALSAVRQVATAPVEQLFVGPSNVARDLDAAPIHAATRVLANRGVAGIDGCVSTALGLAAATGGRTLALLGDLTFLHDVGGLLHLDNQPAIVLDIVVINDRGGAIFADLEQGSDVRAERFEMLFGTPQSADLASLCAGYGVSHVLVQNHEELHEALSGRAARGETAQPGIRVIEVQVSRSSRLAALQRLQRV